MKNIYLITSKDEYLIKKRVLEIISSYNLSEEMLEIYDLDEYSSEELIRELTTISVFDEYRLFWIKNTTGLTKRSLLPDEKLDKIVKYISSPIESTILIFSSSNYYPGSQLALSLSKYAIVEDADKTYNSLGDFANEYVLKENLNISSLALSSLVSKVSDFNSLENELIKLKYYAMGEMIDTNIVDKVVSKNIENKIYEITNAILLRDKGLALSIYNELLEANETAGRIFNNVLSKMLEILYIKKMLEKKLSKEEIAEKFNVSPGRAYYMIKNANGITSEKLEIYLKDLSELNFQARSGNIDEKIGLELFILKA